MEGGKALLADSGHVVTNIVSAEPRFQRALASNPSSVEALADIALSIDQQGRWTEAKAIYEQVLAIDPSSALAREHYVLVLEELNIVDEPKAATLKRALWTSAKGQHALKTVFQPEHERYCDDGDYVEQQLA